MPDVPIDYLPMVQRPDRCGRCRFWFPMLLVAPRGQEQAAEYGECRRHAPGVYHVQVRERVAERMYALKAVEVNFPRTGPSDFCGEFQGCPDADRAAREQ